LRREAANRVFFSNAPQAPQRISPPRDSNP
jgi:hypothetical protein